MKKLQLFFVAVISMSNLMAQDLTDAVRYSLTEVQGTARFRALSGAFGALGGDMSAVSINPAGAAVFSRSHLSISLSNTNTNNEVGYFNTFNNTTKSKLDFSQSGAVFVFNNTRQSSPWRKLALSIGYDKTANFDNQWRASGISNISIDRYFLARTEANQIPFRNLKLRSGETVGDAYSDVGASLGYDTQQVFLGYWGGIIDPLNSDDNTNDNNVDYISNTAPATTHNQSYFYNANGYNGKLTFNIASQYGDNLYIGANLNSHIINYDKFTSFTETNDNASAFAKDILFENRLTTTGAGFSFQLGLIGKLNEAVRVGLTYDSPTWYNFEERLVQNIDSNFADNNINLVANIVNVYPSYKLKTPGKLTGSLAYVFEGKGLLSFDYSRKDYSQTEFRPANDTSFQHQNQLIENTLKAASSYKFGGEYRFKQLSLRGGYRFEESPYKNTSFYGDLTGYSLGLGYNFGNFKVDLTYDQAQRKYNHELYNVGLTNAALIDSKNSNIILTVGFGL